MEWGDLLRVSQRGLWASRHFLWDEAARNIAALLACPSAWDGDHFLQVTPPLAPCDQCDQPSQASGWAKVGFRSALHLQQRANVWCKYGHSAQD